MILLLRFTDHLLCKQFSEIAAMLQARYINPSKLFEEAKTVMSE